MDPVSKLLAMLVSILALGRCAALAGQGNGVLRPGKGGSGIDNVVGFCLSNPEACMSLTKRDETSLRLFLAYLKKRREFESAEEANNLSIRPEVEAKKTEILELPSSGPHHLHSSDNQVEIEDSGIENQGVAVAGNAISDGREIKSKPQEALSRTGVDTSSIEKPGDAQTRLSIVINKLEEIVESLMRKNSVKSDVEYLLRQVKEVKEKHSKRH